jgi:hypothetical protein
LITLSVNNVDKFLPLYLTIITPQKWKQIEVSGASETENRQFGGYMPMKYPSGEQSATTVSQGET